MNFLPHDRKALLRAFYGLLTLWVINGFTGFIRAAGPGAAIIYIELGLLIGYWIWVFYWWRTNRPKAPRSAAKKPRARQTRESVDAEVRRAVDLEEAVARERNRRRKAQLQRTAGKVGSQIGSGLNQLRYVIAGILILSLGIFGYQAYDTNRKQEEARIEWETKKALTIQAMKMWDARNACLASEFEQQWRAWYVLNPQTQEKTILTFSDDSVIIDRTLITYTLPVPATLGNITWEFDPSVSSDEPIVWTVTEGHFKGLIIKIQMECAEQHPAPEGVSDQPDVYTLGFYINRYGLFPARMTPLEQSSFIQRFQWRDVFQMAADALE